MAIKSEELSAIKAELIECIEELKQRLDALERQISTKQPNGQHSYKDLYGCLKGKLIASDELLEECEFRLEWNKIDPAE